MIRELLKNKDLIMYSVKGDLKSQVSQLMLGYLWWLLDPIMYMAVYTLLVAVIFNSGTPNYPLFIFCVLVPWKWTMTTISDCVSSISGKAGLIMQVKVDATIFPITKSLINFFKFFFGMCMVLAAALMYGKPVTILWFYLFPVITIHYLFNLGIGLVMANLGVFFKDIGNILQFVFRIWFYLSPSLWAMEKLPKWLEPYIWLNPLTSFFTSYRNVIFYNEVPVFEPLMIWAIISILLIFYGWMKIKKNEPKYPRVA